MPLQEDQRALLQLLSERGQSYEDISGLLGIPADEVQDKARSALAEIGGSDPDAEVGLTDFLLGQADPIGRADAVRFLQGDPGALELARRIQAEISEVAPNAKQPNLPEPRGKRRRAALPDADEPPEGPIGMAAGEPRSGAPAKLIVALAAGGVILLFAILAFAGVFSGSDESGDGDSSTATSTTGDGTTTAEGQTNITEVPLEPTAGSGVAGQATFGLVDNEQLVVDVEVQGLDPNLASGRSYLVWLMIGESENGYPIDRLAGDENGQFSGRLLVPTPIAVAVGNQAQSVRISSTPVDELQSKINSAVEQEVPVLPFVGTELASGEIPLVRGNGNPADQGQGQGEGG